MPNFSDRNLTQEQQQQNLQIANMIADELCRAILEAKTKGHDQALGNISISSQQVNTLRQTIITYISVISTNQKWLINKLDQRHQPEVRRFLYDGFVAQVKAGKFNEAPKLDVQFSDLFKKLVAEDRGLETKDDKKQGQDVKRVHHDAKAVVTPPRAVHADSKRRVSQQPVREIVYQPKALEVVASEEAKLRTVVLQDEKQKTFSPKVQKHVTDMVAAVQSKAQAERKDASGYKTLLEATLRQEYQEAKSPKPPRDQKEAKQIKSDEMIARELQATYVREWLAEHGLFGSTPKRDRAQSADLGAGLGLDTPVRHTRSRSR